MHTTVKKPVVILFRTAVAPETREEQNPIPSSATFTANQFIAAKRSLFYLSDDIAMLCFCFPNDGFLGPCTTRARWGKRSCPLWCGRQRGTNSSAATAEAAASLVRARAERAWACIAHWVMLCPRSGTALIISLWMATRSFLHNSFVLLRLWSDIGVKTVRAITDIMFITAGVTNLVVGSRRVFFLNSSFSTTSQNDPQSTCFYDWFPETTAKKFPLPSLSSSKKWPKPPV